MNVELQIHKVTDDPSHRFPWRYWHVTETPYGAFEDEGLESSPEDAQRVAGERLLQWCRDQQTARETMMVVKLIVREPDE